MGCSICAECRSNCYNDGTCPSCIRRNNERNAKARRPKPKKIIQTKQVVTDNIDDKPPWD